MIDKSKKLSQAEEKKLAICRERAFDLLKRTEDMVAILEKKNWPQAGSLTILRSRISEVHSVLERCETLQFQLKYGKADR